jgi:hypothetical protein
MYKGTYITKYFSACTSYNIQYMFSKRNTVRGNAYYIIMKSSIYRLMAPYSSKLLYYEYIYKFHYTNIVHLNSKKTVGGGEVEDFHGKWNQAIRLTKPSFL